MAADGGAAIALGAKANSAATTATSEPARFLLIVSYLR